MIRCHVCLLRYFLHAAVILRFFAMPLTPCFRYDAIIAFADYAAADIIFLRFSLFFFTPFTLTLLLDIAFAMPLLPCHTLMPPAPLPRVIVTLLS